VGLIAFRRSSFNDIGVVLAVSQVFLYEMVFKVPLTGVSSVAERTLKSFGSRRHEVEFRLVIVVVVGDLDCVRMGSFSQEGFFRGFLEFNDDFFIHVF